MRDLGSHVVIRKSRAGWTRAWLVVVSLVVGVAATGCSGNGDDPGVLPDRTRTDGTSPSPTPPDSDTATESATPTEDSTEALEAEITEFLEEYVKVSDESWISNNALKRRREMFADSCSICLSGYEMAEDARAKSLNLDGEPGRVVSVAVTAQNDGVTSVLAVIDAPEARLVDPSGEVVQNFESNLGSQVVFQMRLTNSGEWIIVKGETLP